MNNNEDILLLLGRPFLNTTNAAIYVGMGQIHFQFLRWRLKCPFNRYYQQVKISQPRKQPSSSNMQKKKYAKPKPQSTTKNEGMAGERGERIFPIGLKIVSSSPKVNW